MNINNLRKNYDGLTMLERLSLADNAAARDDESEMNAIKEASPKEIYRQTDFYDLMKDIGNFRLCNLIVRLGYIMQFDYFGMVAELESSKKRPSSKKYNYNLGLAKLAAYLYVRATDSWKIVNDELGLRPNYDEEMSKFLISIILMNRKAEVMRKLAFSEDEAKEFIKKQFGEAQMKTIEDEANATREALGLPKK